MRWRWEGLPRFLAIAFCALFFTFEALHPVADLLREGTYQAAATSCGDQGGGVDDDGPVFDAHEAIAAGMSPLQILSINEVHPLFPSPIIFPDGIRPEPPSPVPI